MAKSSRAHGTWVARPSADPLSMTTNFGSARRWAAVQATHFAVRSTKSRFIARIVPKDELRNRRVIIERPPPIAAESIHSHAVTVALHENAGSHREWPVRMSDPTVALRTDRIRIFGDTRCLWSRWRSPRLGRGTVMLTASRRSNFRKGKTQWMVRAGGLSRLWIDDQVVVRTPAAPKPTAMVTATSKLMQQDDPWLRPPRAGHHEQIADHARDEAGPARIILQTMIGGEDLRHDPGEILVAYRTHESDPWQVLSLTEPIPLTDLGWSRYRRQLESKSPCQRSTAQASRINRSMNIGRCVTCKQASSQVASGASIITRSTTLLMRK